MAATFFVAPSGNDANPGTQQSPFLTVNKGVSVAQPGDHVKLAAGIYNESVSTLRGGSNGAPIIIDGQGVARVQQVTFKHPFIHLQNATVSGVTQIYSRLVYIDHGAHHCIMSNNVLDAASVYKIYGIQWRLPNVGPFGSGEVASHVLIVSNTIKNLKGYICISVGGDSNVIRGNFLRDNPQGDFFNVFGRNHLITGNICSNIPFASGLGNHPDFIQTWGNNGFASRGHIIEHNLVCDVAAGQLTQLEANLLPDTRDWTFRNNIFMRIAMQASCTIQDVKYYNNIFYQCNTTNGGHALSFGSRYYDGVGVFDGRTGTNSSHGARLINNVFLDCGDGTSNEKGWYAFSLDLTNVVANYNYVGRRNFSSMQSDAQRRPVGNPGGWSNFDWWEPNGINGGDPGFVNLSNLNFHITPLSRLKAKGLPTPFVTIDFDGILRPNPPSIGAFELRPLRPVAPSGLRIIPLSN